MLTIISPSKNMDFDSSAPLSEVSTPVFLERSAELVKSLRKMTVEEIGELMGISAKLAETTVKRFKAWKTPYPTHLAKQALFAYSGDVYEGLMATSLTPEQITFVDRHVRIISGLYGLLKPLDLILPYRLEMSIALANKKGKNLIFFWKDLVTEEIKCILEHQRTPTLLNLASNEYFKVIDLKTLSVPVVSPCFKEEKQGQYKLISFSAKRARGLMVRFITENKIDKVDGILDFNLEGYRYNRNMSSPEAPTFTRKSKLFLASPSD